MAIRILIADGHELFRHGLKQLLLDAVGATTMLEAGSFEQTVALLSAQEPLELMLVDPRMPGMSGAETLGALRDTFPKTKLVVVSASEDCAD